MKEICITCCWEGIVHMFWLALKVAFWPAIIYAGVYAIGAIAFLANLRAKVGPYGRLEVAHDSWAYMLARPYRYGKIKAAVEDYNSLEYAKRHHLPSSWFGPTSICAVYVRLFNMLLFVWPFVVVYLAAASVLGTFLFAVLTGTGYVSPDLSKEGWLKRTDFRDWDSWPKGWGFFLRVPVCYYVAAFALFMIAFHFTAFLHELAAVFFMLLCILPILAVVVGVVFGSRKISREKDDGTTKVGLAAEFLESKKERWCKVVEIK